MSPYSSNEHEYDNQHGGANQDSRHEMANAAVSTHRPGQASNRQDACLIHCMNQPWLTTIGCPVGALDG
jgi:hypothetical protein